MPGPVIGAEELRRAFVSAGTSFNADMKLMLRGVARPVAADAETLAFARIRRMTVPWAQMRVGSAAQSVYVAPVQRGSRIRSRRRPRFGTLMLTRAMEPALEANRQRILNEVDVLLKRQERLFGGA